MDKIGRKILIGALVLIFVLAILLVVFLMSGDSNTDEPTGSGVAASSAAASGESTGQPDESKEIATEGTVMVEITMEDGGVIKLELDRAAAPITVDNFVTLAEEGFYDGLTFHRIVEGFMVQGGDPDGTGMGGSGKPIKGEFASNGWDNPISHERGVISMARQGNDMNSATSQFFIVHEDSPFLDGDYAAFGRVVEGMDVVDRLAALPVNGESPEEPPVMASIRVVE